MVDKIKELFFRFIGAITGINSTVDNIQAKADSILFDTMAEANKFLKEANDKAEAILAKAEAKADAIKSAVDQKVDAAQEEASEVKSMLGKATDEDN
jgi:cell division septum initiation protein DivIVA